MQHDVAIRRRFATTVVVVALVVLTVAFVVVQAQEGLHGTQEAFNATLYERQSALSARLDKIERMLEYAMFGVVSNLIATLAQIQVRRKSNS